MEKKILDVTCGSRSIWFNKRHPLAIYFDRRDVEYVETFGKIPRTRHTIVHPDVVGDFTELPFEDNTFSLVVFDPPHKYGLKDSWFLKRYGTYDSKEEMLDNIVRGFAECMRVLKPDGVIVFKWSEIQIPTPEIIEAIGYQPLFGHHSGKKMNTNWLCFMKMQERVTRFFANDDNLKYNEVDAEYVNEQIDKIAKEMVEGENVSG